MKLTFWGVRGSVPAPGPEMNRYGGNTSCIEIRTASGARFIVDSGTGVLPLGRKLMAAEFGGGAGEARMFLSHAHWDHIQGFPFFQPVFVPGNRLTIFGPGRSSSIRRTGGPAGATRASGPRAATLTPAQSRSSKPAVSQPDVSRRAS